MAAAFLGAALGLRSLYLEWTHVEPPVAERVAAPVEPLIADAAPRGAAPPLSPMPKPLPPAPKASPAPQPVAHDVVQAAPEAPAPSLPAPAVRAGHAGRGGCPAADPSPTIAQVLVPPPSAPAPAPARPTKPQSPVPAGALVGSAVALAPPALADLPGLVGGVQVRSFRFGGRELRPEVRVARDVGATFVLPTAGLRSQNGPRAGRETVLPAFDTRAETARVLLASGLTSSRVIGEAPGEAASGAYYARLFLGSLADGDPGGQGLMGEGLAVVPLS